MKIEDKIRIMELKKAGNGYRKISIETGIPVSTIASFCKGKSCEIEICPQCGAPVEQNPYRKKKRFCSDKCRTLWWNSHLDQVNRQAYYKAMCQYCGKEFFAYGNDHRKYCSRECSDKQRRENRAKS